LRRFRSAGKCLTPRLELSEEEKIWAGNFIEGLKLVPGTRLVGVNPGATYGAAKMWPAAKYVQMLNELRGRGEFKFLIFGGKAESIVSDEVARGVGEPWSMNLAGKTTVRELAALASWCDVFVTNDTGPMHVAAAVGVPVVAIFGPTDWVTTPPYCDKWTLVRKPIECSPCLKRICPLGHHNCMSLIEPADVLSAIGKWISV
jgi:heptosyltransferase-2